MILLQLLQIPGGKLVIDGLEGVAKSNNQVITGLVVALLVLSYLGFIFVLKYLIKKHKEELAAQLVSNAEKHAIDIGAQQLILKGKDEVIDTLKEENTYLKERIERLTEDKMMILKDNTEAFKHLGTKVGQLSDIQLSLLGKMDQNHESIKVFILTNKPN